MSGPTTAEGRDLLAHAVQYNPADADRAVVAEKIAAIEAEARRETADLREASRPTANQHYPIIGFIDGDDAQLECRCGWVGGDDRTVMPGQELMRHILAASAEPREETAEFTEADGARMHELAEMDGFERDLTVAEQAERQALLERYNSARLAAIGSAASAGLAGEVMSEQCGFRSSVSPQRCYLPSGHAADSPTRFHRFAGPEKWLRDELMILPMLESRREILLALLDDALAEARVR